MRGQAAQHARDLEGEGRSLQAQLQDSEARNRRLKEELKRVAQERDQLQERCGDAKKVRPSTWCPMKGYWPRPVDYDNTPASDPIRSAVCNQDLL